jgi:hypothetical protein
MKILRHRVPAAPSGKELITPHARHPTRRSAHVHRWRRVALIIIVLLLILIF